MKLAETYKQVRKSIVAVAVPSASHDFPWSIVGTGWVLDDCVVATNLHVLESLLQRNEDECGKAAVLASIDLPGRGLGILPITINGYLGPNEIDSKGAYYGPVRPDLGLLLISVTGIPSLALAPNEAEVLEGMEIGTAGFPMGDAAFLAPGYLHQLAPMLQRGIISAVLPFPCQTPHGFAVNVMSQGGCSGSPVFRSDAPEVIGMLHSGLVDNDVVRSPLPDLRLSYSMATSFSYVLPVRYLRHALSELQSERLAPRFMSVRSDAKDVEAVLQEAAWRVNSPRGEFSRYSKITQEGRNLTSTV